MANERRIAELGAQAEATLTSERRIAALSAQVEATLISERRIASLGVMVEYANSSIGRTVSRFIRFIIGDVNDILREIPVSQINGIGLVYTEVDVSALQDPVRGVLAGFASLSISIAGPMDDSPAVSVAGSSKPAVLSGSHDVLRRLNGLLSPRSFGVAIGIQQYYAPGDPLLGLSKTAVDGAIVTDYQVIQNGEALGYTAKISIFTGSAIPTWQTGLIT